MNVFIEKDHQICFSGSGDAHQNGVSERGIQTVIQMARTILISSSMRRPQGTITAELWPMVIDHAVWLYNKMHCKDSSISTYELWIPSSFLPSKDILSICHTRASPTYVL